MTLTSEGSPQDGQAAKEETKLTLTDELKQAFKASEAKDTKDEDVQTENKESADEEDAAETEQKDGEEKEALEKEEVEGQETEEEEETAEKAADKAFPLIPNNWSKDEKAAFQALLDSDNDDLKNAAEIFIERHNSMKKTFYKKTEELANAKKEIKPIQELFAPFESTMKANGVDKATYMKNMIMWETALQRDPVNTIKHIMKQFNVNPSAIVGRKQDDDFSLDEDTLTNEPTSAKVSELEKQLQLLRTQIANQPVQAQLRQFEEATDATGKLKHPHFAEVKPIMGQLLAQEKAKTLDDAYAKAIKTLDLPEDAADDEPDNADDLDKIRQRLKVVKAKKASKGITTKGGKTDFTSMSIKDELRARLKT